MENAAELRLPFLFLWLADHSASMAGDRLSQLNRAIGQTVLEIRRIQGPNPLFPIKMGVIQFASTAEWHTYPTELRSFQWIPIPKADGGTNLDPAIRLADQKIRTELGDLAIPPILVLVSDGETTGYEAALKDFLSSPWGRRSRRRAIAIATSEKSKSFVDFVASQSPGAVIRASDTSDIVQVIRDTAISVLLETVAAT